MSFMARLDKPNPTDGLIGFSYRSEGVTATPDVDYEGYGQTASFRPGDAVTEIIFVALKDDIEEGSETFKLIASDPDGVKLGNTEAIGTITEPEQPSGLPEIAVLADYKSIEEGGQATFTLDASLRPDSSLRVSVTISQTGAFAASGQTGRRNVTIDSSGRGHLSVATVDDNRNEAAGAIVVTVNPGNGYEVSRDSYRSATTAVTDNDLPVVTIQPGSKINEGGTARFTLSASPRPAAPIDVSVNVAQAGDFAGEGQLGARTVTIATNGRGTLSVDTASDTTDEDDGTIIASLGSGSGYIVGTPASASVDVSDGGTPTPRISIRANVSTMVEGDTATFELTANPRPASPLEVRVDVTDSGDFVEQGQMGTRTLAIGTSGTASFSVATVSDLVAEADGTLTAQVLSGAGYLVAAAGSASVTVEDESVKVSIRSDGDIVEGGTATFTLTASPAPPYDLGVEVSISQRGDFLTSGAYAEIVTVGTDGRGTISVGTFNDLKAEDDGAVIATVVGGSEYAAGSPARATANVFDTTPTVTIAAGPTVIEGDTATFNLTANPAPESQLTVLVDVSEGEHGSFAASGESGQQSVLIFPDGSGTLEVRTDDDETNEPNGRIAAQVIPDGAGGYYRIGSPAAASVRVNDNDSNDGSVTVSVADAQVRENARNGRYGRTELHFPVTLSKAATTSVRAEFETRPVEDPGRTSAATPGGFHSGGDYRGDSFALWVNFEPGETKRVLHIAVHDDDEYEELPETFEVLISNVYNAEIGDGVALGTILPDPTDAPRGTPVVTITGGAAVNEGQPATFKLTAKPAPEEDLVVDVTVYDDSLGSAGGYLAAEDEGARQVVIPGLNKQGYLAFGDSVATLALSTVNDSVEEASGKVRVQIEVPADGRYKANTQPYFAEVDVRDNDGPPPEVPSAFSVSNASANESDGSIVFDVTLDPPVPDNRGPMTVFYQIYSWGDSDGGAKPDVDFKAKHGTLTYYAGDSLRQVEIEIIDDDHDEGEEQFVLYISRPTGGAVIADATGRGTIVNSDAMPKAWLGRFGRAAAEQALDGIAERIGTRRGDGERARTAGFSGTVAGVRFGDGPDSASHGFGLLTGDGRNRFVDGLPMAGIRGPDLSGGATDTTLAQLLSGSRFTYAGGNDAAGGALGFWGRGSHTRFDGAEGDLDLDGEIMTALLGADYARNNWLVGVALTQTLADGGHRGDGDAPEGDIESSLTAAIPYASWQASERLSFWGAAGWGAGGMQLRPNDAETLEADIDWTMAAAGLRSDLPAIGGAKLALVSDALWARTESEAVEGLVGTDAAVSRLRVGLEGSRRFTLPGGGSLTPKLEVGMRHDGGDAESGLGVEVGGGFAWTEPRLGIGLDVQGRTLVAHEDGAMQDRGFSASLAYDPSPGSARGLSLALRQEVGSRFGGGLDAFFSNDPLTRRFGGEDGSRWTTELGYGLPAFDGRFVATPHVGYGVSQDAREVGFGWRLTPEARPGAPNLSLSLQATRREAALAPTDHRLGIEVRATW